MKEAAGRKRVLGCGPAVGGRLPGMGEVLVQSLAQTEGGGVKGEREGGRRKVWGTHEACLGVHSGYCYPHNLADLDGKESLKEHHRCSGIS